MPTLNVGYESYEGLLPLPFVLLEFDIAVFSLRSMLSMLFSRVSFLVSRFSFSIVSLSFSYEFGLGRADFPRELRFVFPKSRIGRDGFFNRISELSSGVLALS